MDPLSDAIMKNNMDQVQKLVSISNINEYRDGQLKRSYLHLAVVRGNPDIIKILISVNADLNLQDNLGYTALHLAILQNMNLIINILFEAGAKVIIPDCHNMTALHHIVSKNNTEFTLKFIEHLNNNNDKTSLNLQDELLRTILHYAVLKKNIIVVKKLLDIGINVRLTDITGKTALHHATNIGVTDIVELLLHHSNSYINSKDDSGATPLYLAVFKGYLNLTRLLISKGADVNIATNKKMTPLHIGVKYLEITNILLNAHANINARDELGNTPLYSAILLGNIDVIKALLNAKAEVNITNEAHETPLMLSLIQNNVEIRKLLIPYSQRKLY